MNGAPLLGQESSPLLQPQASPGWGFERRLLPGLGTGAAILQRLTQQGPGVSRGPENPRAKAQQNPNPRRGLRVCPSSVSSKGASGACRRAAGTAGGASRPAGPSAGPRGAASRRAAGSARAGERLPSAAVAAARGAAPHGAGGGPGGAEQRGGGMRRPREARRSCPLSYGAADSESGGGQLDSVCPARGRSPAVQARIGCGGSRAPARRGSARAGSEAWGRARRGHGGPGPRGAAWPGGCRARNHKMSPTVQTGWLGRNAPRRRGG